MFCTQQWLEDDDRRRLKAQDKVFAASDKALDYQMLEMAFLLGHAPSFGAVCGDVGFGPLNKWAQPGKPLGPPTGPAPAPAGEKEGEEAYKAELR